MCTLCMPLSSLGDSIPTCYYNRIGPTTWGNSFRKAGVLLLLTQPNGVDMYDFDGANSNKAGEIQVMNSPG